MIRGYIALAALFFQPSDTIILKTLQTSFSTIASVFVTPITLQSSLSFDTTISTLLYQYETFSHSTYYTSILQSVQKKSPTMTLSAALLLSLTCLHGAFAAPTPQNIQQATCQVEKYTVERTEKIAGKTFMGKSRRGWTVVPLVSENLRDTNINDAQ